MEIISQELVQLGITLNKEHAPVIKRAIHASADFEYAQNLYFSENVITRALSLLKTVHVSLLIQKWHFQV